MTDNIHLDGNAMGGVLAELFGREMTAQSGCCGACGAVSVFAEVHVYRRAPGDVMRCPSCGSVLIVVVSSEAGVRVTVESLRWIEVSPTA
jgi:uncharacterized Zn finger protein